MSAMSLSQELRKPSSEPRLTDERTIATQHAILLEEALEVSIAGQPELGQPASGSSGQ
jgi:hypothetical protein